AERAVRKNLNAIGDAVLGNPAQEVVLAPDAQLHLHGIDLDAAARFLDLSDGDVAQADRANETVALQPREGAHARRERRPRIGRMKLIEIQAFDAERFPAA